MAEKMRAVGIICEYNPLHAGHRYQLDAARRDTGADTVICVMSEYFTQRGELALADPYVRARAAVLSGADLVVGLPYPYSGAPAAFFADAGVSILQRLGASYLHFGSECGEITQLQKAADVLASPAFAESLQAWQRLHPAAGVMHAREACYHTLTGADLPGGSNDLLAVAYLSAIQHLAPSMQPFALARTGQAYADATDPAQWEQAPSALALRTLLKQKGWNALLPLLPSATQAGWQEAVQAGQTVLRAENVETALLAYFRTVSAEHLAHYYGLDGGLSAWLCRTAKEADSFASFLSRAATKRYTDARLRRAIWFGYFGVTESLLRTAPPHVRLLGATAQGRAYLRTIQKECGNFVLTKPADIPNSDASLALHALQTRVEALYSLALAKPREAGYFCKLHPYFTDVER